MARPQAYNCGVRYLVALLFAAILVAQQDPRGRIEGIVTDSSGAVIPDAVIRATNIGTGVVTSGTSNQQGAYEIPFLIPGEYSLTVELTGFKTWTRPKLELRTGDRLRADVALEVGNMAESVQVTAEAPVLQSTNSTVGQVLTGKEASELPLRGGSLAWLYSLAPGVVQPGLPAGGPWNIDQASEASAAGAGRRSFDFNVDGVSNNSYGGRTAFVPPPEMVQEIKIDTTNYDASIGHSLGGSVNVSLKSGTNDVHGIWSGSIATGPMVTRNFFVNRYIFDTATGPVTPEKIAANTPQDRWFRTSGSVGGPVVIPGLYNGRNRTFWQFGFQLHDRSQPVNNQATVPTEAQRGGDFSALLRLGPQYQIYDPNTARIANGRVTRSPFPGNIIPRDRLDPRAQALLKYWPMPNTEGSPDGLQNYNVNTPKIQRLVQPIARIDHNAGEKVRLFGRYSHSDFDGQFDRFVPDSDVRGRLRQRPHRGAALDAVFVLSPQVVYDVRYGFTWFREVQAFVNQGWNLSEFGFSDSLIRSLNPQGVTFPQIQVQSMLQLGNDGGFKRTNYTHSLMNVLNWTRGSHSIRFGADSRLAYENNITYGNAAPQFAFDTAYTRGPADNSPAAPTGQGLASFLLGIPTGGRIDINDSRAESSSFWGFFAQDDWRIHRNLTINLGLRYELETPTIERFDRTTLDFDFASPNPIEAQARAQYAASPIPEIPASQFRTIGGLTFAGQNGLGRRVRDTDYRAIMPRIGFAWQLAPNSVLRGGYGIYYGLLGANFTDVSQPGFNQRTSVVPSLDGGVTFAASLSNPFPSGVEQPLGSRGGLTTFVGRAPGFFSRDGRRPQTQRWNMSLQFQPMDRTVVELGYIGSRSGRIRVATEFNPVPMQYRSTSPVRDQDTINFLTAQVNNPFRGIDAFAGSNFYAPRVTQRMNLLRPYPHFASLSEGLPAGMSWYHGLTTQIQRRFSRGLQFQANYTWSKTMEAVSYRNDFDSLPEHVVADLDRPHRFVGSGVAELPFGRGKAVGSNIPRWLNMAVGGWQVQAIYQWQSGPPLTWGNVLYTGDFTAIRADSPALDRWFNTSGFNTNARDQLQNNIRTFPTRISAVRGAGLNNWDIGLFKSFSLGEKVKLQLRADAEGAFNSPHFNEPNTSPANTLFGRVTSTQTGEGERRIFAGARVTF